MGRGKLVVGWEGGVWKVRAEREEDREGEREEGRKRGVQGESINRFR